MPTDLPPDYKPEPARPEPAKPGDGKAPSPVPQPGEADSKDGRASPQPGGRGLPGQPGDVVHPPGWKEPEGPGGEPAGVPQPAGTPTF